MRGEDPDYDVVERVRRDPSAFGELFDRYYASIFGYALRRTGNIANARDIAAETFLRALQHLRRFRWQGAPFSAWLFRIAANEIASTYRRRRLPTDSLEELQMTMEHDAADRGDLEAELVAAEEEVSRHTAFLRIQQLLERLPPRYQEVIALRYFEEMTIPEIAAITGKREGTVKSLLSRGLAKLRRQYDER